MERVARIERLVDLVAQARQVQALAHPTTAYLLRVLSVLTPDDLEELGRWQLRNERAEGIVDRVTAELGEQRQGVRRVLSDCLRLDVWGDYDRHYATVRQRYEASGEPDVAIERSLRRPPHTYSVLLHGCVNQWLPKQEDFSTLIIEDDRWGAICDGFLVAKGRAFSTKLALMEASIREGWQNWQALWRWF